MTVSVSVIVTAYNRRDYLLSAVSSVKGADEVVVVKNFKDETIDPKLNELKVKSIYCDDPRAGTFVTEGISQSRGDVICFLDDDDMFTEDKLSVVRNAFEDTNVVFFYNSRYIIDEGGKVIGEEVLEDKEVKSDDIAYLFRNRLYFNSSSMCIRREIVESRLEDLRRVKRLVDNFFLLSAVSSKGAVRVTSKKLTYYRLHRSSSVQLTQDFNEFTRRRVEYFRDAIADNEIMTEVFEGKARRAAECSKEMAEIQRSIAEGKRCINFIWCEIFTLRTLLYANLACLVSLFSPNLPRKLMYSKYRGLNSQ